MKMKKKYMRGVFFLCLFWGFCCRSIPAEAENIETEQTIIENRDYAVTGEETEENNSVFSATEMSMEAVLSGSISGEKDVDYYHIHFNEKCMGRVLLTLPYNMTKGMFRVAIFYKKSEDELIELHNLYSGEIALNYSTTFLYIPGDYYFVVSGNEASPFVKYHIQFSHLYDEAGKITSLYAGLGEGGNIELNWGRIFSATGYHIYLKENDYTKIGTVPGADGGYTYLVKDSGDYSFVVVPYYQIGDEEWETYPSNEISYSIPSKLQKPKVRIKKYKRRYAKVAVKNFNGANKVFVYIKKGGKGWIRKKTLTPKKRSCKIKAVKKCFYRFKTRGYVAYGSKKMYSRYTGAKKLNFKK